MRTLSLIPWAAAASACVVALASCTSLKPTVVASARVPPPEPRASSSSATASAIAPPPASAHGDAAPIPPTPSRPVTDAYHGVSVVDPYRWLEPWNDEVKAWTAAETRHARAAIERLPGYDAIKAQLHALKDARSPTFYDATSAGGKVFLLEHAPPRAQPMLVVVTSPDDAASARVLVDPTAIDPSGKTTIDFFRPSFDGTKVCVSLSKGGTEHGDLAVYDVATGKALPDAIAHVNDGTAGGSVAWNARGTGFWYTRYPREGERPPADTSFYQEVYFHKLGAKPADDAYVAGKGWPRIAEVTIASDKGGRGVLLRVANGDGGDVMWHLLDAHGDATKIADYDVHATTIRFGDDASLWAVVRGGAPRGKVVHAKAGAPGGVAQGDVVVAEGEATIVDVEPSAHGAYVLDDVGGPSQVRFFDARTRSAAVVPTPEVSSVFGITVHKGDEALVGLQSYLAPPGLYRYAPGGSFVKTALATRSPASFDDAHVVRETCAPRGVPITLVERKGTARDGDRPTVLTGYGGFNVSLRPSFRDDIRLLLDRGGVFVVANLRGGGEFGEAWHQAGSLKNKQNVFDDMAACAARLVALKVTRPERLAMWGGSNGGLLMGAMITQHPELARAYVSAVGYYDMLRMETEQNGEFNATEYGSVKDKALFEAMYAYSPYHHVVTGTRYPAVLLTTGTNDPRVAPWHSRKMAARLQAADPSASILLMTRETGHGIGSSLADVIAQLADTYTFTLGAIDATPAGTH